MPTTNDAKALSLAEQAALGSGADFWSTKAVGGVPRVVLTDGPHGVRLQPSGTGSLNILLSRPATCFPPAVALGQSWDPDLIRRVGAALGRESQALGVHVLLGPGINIKRDPRCGRNFEYYSEDPFIAGVLGSAWVQGIQSEGVGASVKHFAANNQETDRFLVSADLDMRTLREIYLRAFERVVTDAKPWTVMAAYNRINGVYATENRWLLTEVLRDEWGFEGVVVSDWGAAAHRAAAVAAGLDLEMPGWGGESDTEVVAAVSAGRLDADAVARAAERVAALAVRASAAHRDDARFDVEEHHALAREVAARGIVLLQNNGPALPLDPSESLAVIGAFATTPRYQGGGSSRVEPTRLDIPFDEIRLRSLGSVTFAAGFRMDGTGDAAALRDEAVQAASAATAAVVFIGLPEAGDSEAADRQHIELPAEQLEVLDAVAAVQRNTVVVLMHGGMVRLAPVVTTAAAIMDAALLGQGGGAAIADVLFGVVNPSGKLTETVPVRVEDTPAYLTFPGFHEHVRYAEGLHVGYRWYDARAMEVTFPFGHGLSYTTFEYSQLTVEPKDGDFAARLTVTNSGTRRGREVVQFYIGKPDSDVVRAPRQLVGFASVTLNPGESTTVEVLLQRRDLAYWDERVNRWVVEGGEYTVWAGASSRDLRAHAAVTVAGDVVALPLSLDTAMGDLIDHRAAAEAIGQYITAAFGGFVGGNGEQIDATAFLLRMPLGRIAAFSGGAVTKAELQKVLSKTNVPETAPDARGYVSSHTSSTPHAGGECVNDAPH